MHLCLLLSVLLSQFAFSLCQNPVYHFIHETKSWYEARQYCRMYYTDLAMVNNMTDLERLKQVANGHTDAWIGLHQKSDNLSNREWHWSQPGIKYNESEAEWRTTSSEQEPTDKGDGEIRENCVVVDKDGQWIDSNCMSLYKFICYNESSNTTHLINESKSWLDAQGHCRNHHTDLTSGRDQLNMTDDMIDDAVEGKEQKWYWIGLFRDTWGWSDGSKSSFRIWDEWENILDKNPDNITKKCATLGAMGKLGGRVSCDGPHSFICYDERFILVRENKTWEEALIHCRRHHLDLAWHNGPHQRRMVQERAKMADSEVVWLGLHFTCFFEEWIWVNGHYVPRDDENWKDRRNNKCEVSGAMQRGGRNQWVKRFSEEKHNFICVR